MFGGSAVDGNLGTWSLAGAHRNLSGVDGCGECTSVERAVSPRAAQAKPTTIMSLQKPLVDISASQRTSKYFTLR